jgi:hypothetical protein
MPGEVEMDERERYYSAIHERLEPISKPHELAARGLFNGQIDDGLWLF